MLTHGAKQSDSNSSNSFFDKSGQKDSFFGEGQNAGGAFFGQSLIQPKLSIGQPDDKYEQEADAMANQVVQKLTKPDALQRKCASCEQEEGSIAPKLQTKAIFESNEEAPVQRKCEACKSAEIKASPIQMSAGSQPDLQASSDLESRLNSSKGGGQPLAEDTQQSMSNAFGTDFSGVRVHTGSSSVQMNQELGARAFTNGSDIYFNSGEYSPETSGGQHLLAHELTHVVQQGAKVQAKIQKEDSCEPDDVNNEESQSCEVPNYSVDPEECVCVEESQAEGTEESPKKTPKEKALDLIEKFEKESSSSQAFGKLSKAKIVEGLKARVNNPVIIDQNQLNVCGPAATLFIFASSDPKGYAKMGISLFKYGSYSGPAHTIQAGDDLKSKAPSDYKWSGAEPAEVDWMMLSSMRDSENDVNDFEGSPEEDFSGMTLPGEIKTWLSDLLGMSTVEDDTNLYFNKDVDHVEKVNKKFNDDHFVVLFIHSKMISNSKKKKGSVTDDFPNHWVVLKSEINVKGETLKFKIWTWGQIKDIEVSKENFENTYYGAVFGKN